jgi:glycosyltransferase involved in cell wall biosynthesis
MIDLLILGQPYWGLHLARDLNKHAPDIRATFIPQSRYLALLARPPRSDRLAIMRAGYRVGATTPRGRLFDAYWSLLERALPNAAVCHYWLGTDVLNTLEEARAGTLHRDKINASRGDLHLAAAPWLVSELEEVGIHAVMAHVQPVALAPHDVPPMPDVYSVLSYVPGARFGFYGGPAIIEAARRLADVRFDIVGRGEPDPSAPPNVRWHGWVENMAERYADASVVVRLPQHDAFGGTVVEGLFNARHVVYSYDVPHVRRVWPVTPEALTAVLDELRAHHAAGKLAPNLAGRAYALEEFDEHRVANDLAGLLRARLGTSS